MFASHIMGCILCKWFKKSASSNGDESRLVATDTKKEYSWDRKPKVDPKDYTIENIVDSEVIREPNTVNGRQFIIQNCKNTNIFVLDHCNSVTIDDCADCQIVLGPMSGSLFIRGSENVTLVALCGQFRARDCRNVSAFLCCTSQPSIEACSKFEFGCALLQYKGLEGQIGRSNLSLFNNQWNLIYDFTPVPSEGPNWQLLQVEKIASLEKPGGEKLNELGLAIGERDKSTVPFTTGVSVAACIKNASAAENDCFVAITQCSNQTGLALEFISCLGQMENVSLVQSKEAKTGKDEAQKLLTRANKIDELEINIIGLHYQGTNCAARCHQIAGEIINRFSCDTRSKIHISENSTEAWTQINTFFSCR